VRVEARAGDGALTVLGRCLVARRGGAWEDCCSRAWSAERAAVSALISSLSLRSRVSIESTMSWFEFILLMLRTRGASLGSDIAHDR
jgi:hypothetical protein